MALTFSIGAAIGAAVALAWNFQQPSISDFNDLKDRVVSLEGDQTSICTTVGYHKYNNEIILSVKLTFVIFDSFT